MRFLFPIAALIVAGLSILPDMPPFSHSAGICRWDICRFDQMFSRIDAQGMNPANVGVLLNQDPLDPRVWCTYGEQLALHGQEEAAEAAFERAIQLGPQMAPILMRAANFDFAHDRIDHGSRMAYRILKLTNAFDEILFSYLTASGTPAAKLIGTVIPPTPDAARAWIFWSNTHGTDADLLQSWYWMQKNRLTDLNIARYVAWVFWNRKSFMDAQEVWADWLGPAEKGYLHPERLTNTRFQYEPGGSPFDWTLAPPPSVQLLRQDGLEIRFSGTENVDFSQVHQFATVKPRHYRLSVEASATGLTTDQRPVFHVFDALNAARLNVQTQPFSESVGRSWTTLDFDVKQGTEVVAVQIERHPSQHFDNKIAGTLHVYQISLVPRD